MTTDVPTTVDNLAHWRPGVLAAVSATAFVIGAALSLTWLAMRAVMALGGMVASGGPYAIEHAAPGWIWLVPVAIVALIVGMMTSKGLSDSHDTPSLYVLTWSALFLSLGYNFLDFGLHAPGGGTSIAWLVCAALFFLMGGGGLYVFFVARMTWREMDEKQALTTGVPLVRAGYRVYQVATGVALAVGVAAGWGVFQLLAR